MEGRRASGTYLGMRRGVASVVCPRQAQEDVKQQQHGFRIRKRYREDDLSLVRIRSWIRVSGHQNWHHHIHLVPVVNVCVGNYVVVALRVNVKLVVVIVVIVEVVVDVGHDGEDVHGGGEEGHLGDVHCCGIRCRRTPDQQTSTDVYTIAMSPIFTVCGRTNKYLLSLTIAVFSGDT